MNLSTPYHEAHHQLTQLGWELESIKQKNGLWVAKGGGPGDTSGERIGQSPEMALAALVLYAQRANKIRTFAAIEKVAAWEHDFTPKQEEIARAYSKLPAFEAKAVPAWRALAEESRKQADAIRKQIKVENTDEPEPYMSHHEMREDVHHKKRYKATRANADHPVWTPEEVANFRIVHDVIGHAGGNADYSWEGENKAAAHHFPHLTPLAREALFVETIGRSAYDHTFHGHGPRKVALMTDQLNDAQSNEGDHITIPHGATPDSQQVVNEVLKSMPDGGYVEPTRQARDLFTSLVQRGQTIRQAHATTVAYLGMHAVPEDDRVALTDNIMEDYALAAAAKQRVAAWVKVGDWIKESAEPGAVYQKLLKRPDITQSEPLMALLKEFIASHSGQTVMGNLRYMEWFLGRIKRIMKGGGEVPPNHVLLEDAIRIFDMLEESKRRNLNAPDIFQMEYGEARQWANEMSKEFYEQDNRWQSKDSVFHFKGADKGWTIDKLSAHPDFNTEGRMMGHCVGGSKYWNRHDYGQTDVFSLRDPQGNPHATIELLKRRYNHEGGGFKETGGGDPSGSGVETHAAEDPTGDQYVVLQAFGKSDQPPVEKYRKMIGQWFKAWGIHEESSRKTEGNWDDGGGDGGFHCNGGYGAHDNYEYWDSSEAPPEKIRSVEELFMFEQAITSNGSYHQFTDFHTECPYADEGGGPGNGYFDLKHRADYGMTDDYEGHVDGGECEGMEVEGYRYPDVDWETLFQDILRRGPQDDEKIADDIADYFVVDAKLQYEKSWTNQGQSLADSMSEFMHEVKEHENAWQVEPHAQQPQDDIERIKSIYDIVAGKLPELKKSEEQNYANRLKNKQDNPHWDTSQGDPDDWFAPHKEQWDHPTFGTRWSIPNEGQGQMYGDMWVPFNDQTTPEEKLLEVIPQYAQDEVERLVKGMRDGSVDTNTMSSTPGLRRELETAIAKRVYRDYNVRIDTHPYSHSYGDNNPYRQTVKDAAEAAIQWMQQQTDVSDVRQHALDAWRQKGEDPSKENWDWMDNPTKFPNKDVVKQFPHMFESPYQPHGYESNPSSPAADVIRDLKEQYNLPPGMDLPPDLVAQIHELQSSPDKYKLKVPNPYHYPGAAIDNLHVESATNRERDPDYRFVYYNTGLAIEPWHHNLRFRELRKKLLEHFGVDEIHITDDDHNEWASGDVWKDPDGTFQIELKNLASEAVQLAAITAVHDWLDR